VILGHMYRCFTLSGGRRATALGVLLGLSPWLRWVLWRRGSRLPCFFRYSSLAALISAAFAAFFTLILFNAAHPFFPAVAVIVGLLIWRHRANIRNLLAGKERNLARRRSLVRRQACQIPARVHRETAAAGAAPWPCCSRSAPANAIIAPLSVQNSSGG